ncbi:MAG: nucleotidyltransferase family protein [Longimicrobiaceae bacterium]
MIATPLSSLSPEAQLVLLAAGGPAHEDQIAALLRAGLRWPLVLEIARREGAVTILWQRLQSLPQTELPSGAASLRTRVMLSEFRQQYLGQRLDEALEVLSDAGIRVLLLKGAALALTVYGSFARRPMGDLDLLVEPARAAEAQQLLLANGWKESRFATREQFYSDHHHLPPLDDARGTGIELELHTDLFFRGHPFQPLPAKMWEGALPLPGRSGTVLVPRLVHQHVYLCIHFAWSHMLTSGGWRTFRDVNAILSAGGAQWDEFTRLARETRAASCCYWTLRLARNLVGVEVPEEVLKSLQPPLPERVLPGLERHFTHEMLPTESVCPSVRVGYAAWELAIRPEWSGHGAVRPWSRVPHFTEGIATEPAAHGGQKLVAHLRKLSAWGRYLRTLAGSTSPPSAATPTT